MQKREKVRLNGEALKQLNLDIHERDNYQCIITGEYVPLEEKFHHEPCGSDKQDTLQTGLLLSYRMHYNRHHGKNAAEIKELCNKYLEGLYGGANSVSDIRS